MRWWERVLGALGYGKDRLWQVEFKRQDLWIGAFWKYEETTDWDDEGIEFTDTVTGHLWICLIPMVPIHFHWTAWDTCNPDPWIAP